MVSQIKITRQAAPKAPPTWVSEKKMKKLAPNAMHTHGCADGRTRRKRIAAGTRNKIKYANVLKIIRCRRGGVFGKPLAAAMGGTPQKARRIDLLRTISDADRSS